MGKLTKRQLRVLVVLAAWDNPVGLTLAGLVKRFRQLGLCGWLFTAADISIDLFRLEMIGLTYSTPEVMPPQRRFLHRITPAGRTALSNQKTGEA